jgi:hypothetical protein
MDTHYITIYLPVYPGTGNEYHIGAHLVHVLISENFMFWGTFLPVLFTKYNLMH